MKPQLFLYLVCTAFALLVYLAFEVLVFRLACRLARVHIPTPARTIGLTFAVLIVAFLAEGALAGLVERAYTAGGFPLWEAGLVGFFLGLPVHMVLASAIHAKLIGNTVGEALSVWFVEKSMKLALVAVAAGVFGLVLLVQRIGGVIPLFATCARGLEAVLARELAGIGATQIEPGRGGVSFQGTVETVYRANLSLRTAVRVLRPVKEAEVPNPDALYEFVRSILWSEYMTPDHTLAVDCNVRDSAITHSQYAARRVKDAICDQFRDRTGRRPSVDTERPMIGLNLHIHRNHAILSLDSSWDSLHKRGYRPIQSRAPLNEALAAGLLLHLGYDGSAPLVDLMCGSGTFLVEGCWIGMRRPPGLTRKWFSFFGWQDFDPGTWAAIRDEARNQVLPPPPFPPRGSDVRQDAVDFAAANAKAAGVGHLVKVEKLELRDARPNRDDPPGLIVLNPPYGERLGEEEELVPLYRRIGAAVGEFWPGWKLAVFTSNDRLAKQIKLPVVRQTPFFNGSLACKLWEFQS